jgi:hypothetical protein
MGPDFPDQMWPGAVVLVLAVFVVLVLVHVARPAGTRPTGDPSGAGSQHHLLARRTCPVGSCP